MADEISKGENQEEAEAVRNMSSFEEIKIIKTTSYIYS